MSCTASTDSYDVSSTLTERQRRLWSHNIQYGIMVRKTDDVKIQDSDIVLPGSEWMLNDQQQVFNYEVNFSISLPSNIEYVEPDIKWMLIVDYDNNKTYCRRAKV